jgi:ketosteroid isomerase-like protein
MPTCPKCGAEIAEGDNFCTRCGTRFTELPQSQITVGSSIEDEVRNVIVKRFDAIKNRDEATVRALIDEHFSKFDDWSPYRRQEVAEALQNEFSAFKVLSNYNYELSNFEVNVIGNVAVATFTIHYVVTMRNMPFDVLSRVTSVLRKQDSEWKVVHEHLSRFPEEAQRQSQRRGRFPF